METSIKPHALIKTTPFQGGWSLFVGITIAICLFLGACGSKETLSIKSADQRFQNQNNVIVQDPNLPPIPPRGFFPTISHSFTLAMQVLGVIPTFEAKNIETDNVLKIRITPGPADLNNIIYPENLSGLQTGFAAQYSCARFTVSVLGRTVTTQILAVPQGNKTYCPNAPSSQIIDFSDRLTPGRTGFITVSVSNPNTDAGCHIYDRCAWNPYTHASCWAVLSHSRGSFCPAAQSGLKPSYLNHVVTGELEIEVNDPNN